MKNKLLLLFLSLGWILLGLFLISGHFYKQFSTTQESNFFTPVAWDDHLQMFDGAIQCSLTSDELMERKQQLKQEVFGNMLRKEEVKNGYVYFFPDDLALLEKALEFIKAEKSCCPFFKFDLSILPFKGGFAVQISGSEKAFEFLKDFENSEF